MGKIQFVNERQGYIPSLEGIRGYAFLLVFFAHYFWPSLLAHPGTIKFGFLQGIMAIAFFTVPTFFVLSGFLIGGILYNTQDREGYFKAFYGRRILRVFPLYYLTLLAVACFAVIQKYDFVRNYHFWSHFLYIHNICPGYTKWHNSHVDLIHFWSLGIEEQFYLLWPLVVWFLRDRRKLIGFTSLLIVGICGFRFLAPFFLMMTPLQLLYSTSTRVDGILLGVLLALVRPNAMFERIKPFAKWVTLSGITIGVILALCNGEGFATTFVGAEIWIPLANFTAFAIVVAVMEENSWMNWACSRRWICSLGKLSYGLYVFHLIYMYFFMHTLAPRLARHMWQPLAILSCGVLAFLLTLALALLSYRFIESPLLKLKGHMKYGAKMPAQRVRLEECELARTGT
jgi:peptidoglycan/LPS O-acetylase OafA/YrhL